MDLLEAQDQITFNDASLYFGELRFSFDTAAASAFEDELNSSSSFNASSEELFIPNSVSEEPSEHDEYTPAASASSEEMEYLPDSLEPETKRKINRSTSTNNKKKKKKRRSPPKPNTPKKRKAVSEVLDEVKLPRSQLLSITSDAFEQMVANTRNVRAFTKAEEAEVKRQMRLIKNRESAAASRARKRQSMDRLQQKNDALQQELEELRAQNEELKAKESNMTRFLDSCGKLKAWVDSYSTLGGGKKNGSFNAGASMFILLFSFGLLFNTALVSSNNKLPLIMSSSMAPGSLVPGANANLRQILEVADEPPDMIAPSFLRTILCKSDVDNVTNTMPIQVMSRTPQEIKCFF